ncbi:hypothetical protein GCM10022223_60610 [Kineosporia mesophila]|uniref:Glycosyl transferase family 1 domain-containing protein n=1 Tax=Kineosporia mesophila TaxID=566012 RepID=A0ABP7AK55_9ACTN|nr:glycosyltransferase [Kineosporia mesophila]
MPDFDFPDGQYLAVTVRLALDTGGQTAMFLLRSRLFAERAGIVPTLVSFDDQPDYPRIRAELAARGSVAPSTVIVNLFEWFRNERTPLAADDAALLPPVPGLKAHDVPHPDGTVHLTAYRSRDGSDVVTDHRRADGSVYLRQGPDGVVLCDRRGRVVREFSGVGALRRWWLTGLFDDQPRRPVIIMSDSRFATRQLVPLTNRRRVRLIHVVHNIHVQEPYQWDSPVHPTHLPVIEAIPRLHALVMLTERQRDEIAARFGAMDNVHVIPNPIDHRPGSDRPLDRHHADFVMLGRLEKQKRLEDAVVAFAKVVTQQPQATLTIYGEGSQRAELEKLVGKLGLRASVRLPGHDPAAKDYLRSATALLLTSRFEGYPLVVLEALDRGCPVIAYDIAYGPREQIADGESGYLVPAGDTGALAERMLRLIADPDLTARMSTAARLSSASHSIDAYLTSWQGVLRAVTAKA